MLTWMAENGITVAVVAMLTALVALAVWSLLHDKQKGKSSCGGNCGACSACPMSGKCHGRNA